MQLLLNNSPSAKQAYMKHCKLGHLWRSAALHTMHNSRDWGALICSKSAWVFYPLPIRCDKPTGAELMLLKSCTSCHVLFVWCVFSFARRHRCGRGEKKKSCKWTQSWVNMQQSSVLPKKSQSVSFVMPFLDFHLLEKIYFPSQSDSCCKLFFSFFLLPCFSSPVAPSMISLYYSIKGKAFVRIGIF